jgi:hypothetical protein
MSSLVMSTELNNVVRSMSDKFEACKALVTKTKDDVPIDYLGVKVEGENVFLTFLDKKRVKSVKPEDTFFTTPQRQEGKVGKVLKKVIPEISENELRTFTEALQGIATKAGYSIFAVDGTQIFKYYIWPKERCTGFGGSCYQGAVKYEYFELFENNPTVFGAIISMHGDRLDGRAIYIRGKNAKTGTPETILVEHRAGSERGRILLTDFAQKNGYSTLPPYGNRFTTEKLVPGKQLHHWDLCFDGKVVTNGSSYCAPNSHSSTYIDPLDVVQEHQKRLGII